MDKKKIFERFWEQYVDFNKTIYYINDAGVDLYGSSIVDPFFTISDLMIVNLFGEEGLNIFNDFVGECYELSDDDSDELYNLLTCKS